MEKNQQNKCLPLIYTNTTATVRYYGNLFSNNPDVDNTKLTSEITLPLNEALGLAHELTRRGYTFKFIKI